MRHHVLWQWTLLMFLGFTAAGRAEVSLQLSDPGLPLQEVRPLDRRVYILSLEGKWNQPSLPGMSYYVNILFPDGDGYSHGVTDAALFRQGEVRSVIQGYQLARHGLSSGGKLEIFVSAGKAVTSSPAPEIVSNRLEIAWPMDRPIVYQQPRTRFSEAQGVDAFSLPSEPRPPERIVPPQPRGTRPLPGAIPGTGAAPGISGGTGTTPGGAGSPPPAVPGAPGKAPEPVKKPAPVPPPDPRNDSGSPSSHD